MLTLYEKQVQLKAVVSYTYHFFVVTLYIIYL